MQSRLLSGNNIRQKSGIALTFKMKQSLCRFCGDPCNDTFIENVLCVIRDSFYERCCMRTSSGHDFYYTKVSISTYFFVVL